MGFAGNLNTLSLAEVFQTINRIRATGVLRLAAIDHGRDLVFADGEIIGLHFRAGEEKLGLLRRLILEGRIDANAAANISNSKKDSSYVLEGLIEKGQLTEADVIDALQKQAEDELYNLCTWEFADFVFHDVGPDAPGIGQEVETCKQRPLRLNVNSILMESARRMDDWEYLRTIITSEEVVLGPADGQEQALLEASQSYPGSAVVPLIDAVRTVGVIIKESVATRLDVYSVLAQLIKNGMVADLSRDDIIAHGDYQFQEGDFQKAAELFRRALSEDPTDSTTCQKLAESLEQLGEQPDAAGCYAQLALGMLDAGDGIGAVESAKRAVRLAEEDPRLRMILIRCLLDSGNKSDAITQLKKMVSHYVMHGQLEDARGTCLKILELDPDNEDSRRNMARIFASAEGDNESEDVVVCVQCKHINHREETNCKECNAPLRLSCQSCNRTVAVSDKICIFCGANPHVEGKRKLLASPATTKIVNKSASSSASGSTKGSAFWRKQLEENVKKARELEVNGDVAGALEAWREVAKVNSENKELLEHIRDLEERASDDHAEKMIELGHKQRRGRRFGAALKSYRSAIRTIPESDPRHPRLKEILVATQKDQRRIFFIYGSAILIVCVFGLLLARPYLKLSSFRSELTATRSLLNNVTPGTTPATFESFNHLSTAIANLDTQVQDLGTHATATTAKNELDDFKGDVVNARLALISASEKELQTALQGGNVARAEQLLTSLRDPEFKNLIAQRFADMEKAVADARKLQADVETRRAQATEQIAAAQEAEKAGYFGKALSIYRSLTDINHPTATPVAQEGVKRLEPDEKAYKASLGKVANLINTNIGEAQKSLLSLANEAKKWGAENQVAELQKIVIEKNQAAAAAYQKLGANPTQEALQSFIENYPNTAQAEQARVRYDQMVQAQKSRDEQISAYKAAIGSNQIEQAWRIARNLFAGGGTLPPDVRLPIQVDSVPAGAQVSINGEVQGITPYVVQLLPNQVQHTIAVGLSGWEKTERKVGEITGDWRAQFLLTRTPRWKISLGKPVNGLMSLENGHVIALAGDALHMIDNEGKLMWRTSVAAVDELQDVEHFKLAHQPIVSPDGTLLVGLPTKDIAHIDKNGSIKRRLNSVDAVRGRPQVYTNDLLGGQLRLAYASDKLYFGAFDKDPVAIDLPSTALSGPIIFPHGPDRLLAVATIQGQLVAIEESSKNRLWQSDLKATEIGQLVPISGDSFVTVLDGSRISCFQITDSGMRVRWNVPLPGAAIGDPVLAGNAIWQAAGIDVVRISLEGIATPISGKSPLVTPIAAHGNLVAVGNKSGQILVFQDGKALWASQCTVIPSSLACTGHAVVVGLVDGTLSSYAP